jgi:hypothetical protein
MEPGQNEIRKNLNNYVSPQRFLFLTQISRVRFWVLLIARTGYANRAGAWLGECFGVIE